MEEYMFGIIMAAIAGVAAQNYKNHGCIKKIEGTLSNHLQSGNKN